MVETTIKEKLEQAFPKANITITNFSSQHIGHDPGGAHIAVHIQHQNFKGKTLIEQHREVYKALKKELENGSIHALKITTKET